MSADRQSLYITWLFATNGYPEVAQTGMHVAASSPGTNIGPALAAVDSTVLGDLLTEMDTLITTAPNGFATYGRLTGVKVAQLTVDGDYVTEPKLLEDSTPLAGTQGEVLPQSTVVLSLRSGQTFGRANYGKMYLPYHRYNLVTGTPLFSETDAQNIANKAADFVAGVNIVVDGLGGVDLSAAIISRVGAGTTKFITRVDVDNLHDTQRRRARQLDGVYKTAPVA